MNRLFTPLSTFSGGGRLVRCRMLHFVFVGLLALSFVPFGVSLQFASPTALAAVPTISSNPHVTSFTLDGVTVKVHSPFLPDTTFVTSKAGDAIQGAISVSYHPYREFSVVAVPFGTRPGSEAVPVAKAGGADAYRLALDAFRLKQGDHPQAGPTATLFGQQVAGEVSLSRLHLDSSTLTSTRIVEWVVEAGQRLWIVRVAQEQTREGMTPLQTLSAITLSSTTLDQPSTLPNVNENHVHTPDGGQKPHGPQPFDLSNPSWWSGTCDSNNNGGSYPLGANYQGMLACGPLGGSYVVHFFPGAWGVLEWQCVELSMRYLYLAYRVNPYPANGSQVVWNYSGSALQKISNGTANQAPQAGDVLSYGSTQSNGHTSVVSSSNVNGAGNGSITVIEENASYNGSNTISVVNWVVQPTYGMNITGWLHNPVSPQSNLFVMKRSNTGSHSTEVHILNGGNGFQSFLLHTGTALGETGTDGSWQFLVGPYNGDGQPDLWAIDKYHTGTHTTEVHILSAATNYQTFLLHTGTALHETGNDQTWQFLLGDYNGDGKLDLYAIDKQNTGTHTTEVHILDGATNFQTFLLHTGTALHETGTDGSWMFVLGDYNGDGRLDLYAIDKYHTGTHTTEVHILNGADNFQSFLLHTGTALGETGTDGSWMFALGDYNGDGKLDLYAIDKYHTGTHTTEVHILNGGNGFQSFLLHTGTALGETGVDWGYEFALR